MAIKISGTEVINDLRELVNITGANGVYSNFHTSPQTVATTTLDFNHPIQYQLMSANRTYTETNKATGRHSLFLLDTSSSGYTPTFSANIKWKNGTEPTWANYRHWMISMQCVSGTVVRAAAEGYTGSAPAETITLTGTVGSPTLVGLIASSSDYARVGQTFVTDGSITEASGTGGNSNTLFGNWCNVTPSQTYYIRCTQISTSDPGVGSAGDAQPLNTWLALSSSRSFMVIDTTPTLTYGTRNTVVKIEIASDSGGSNILATGYYKYEWDGLA